ncbi:hypothetical protein SAMN04515671_3880 [Nakamurella panacisegetis]|uniref:Uncharacterized protein n=1 Tax=Nakamurella panacisegetis TaxID=1090615 RepID=A0A1H0S2Z7_9ACTN|nr:hypothetical protein [Nakamurella panacisegetis]SDP36090.1 hypothetical protein SAMN04515671_3880 [Nakamurella panacisegetis]
MSAPLGQRFCVRIGCPLRGRRTEQLRCANCEHTTEPISEYYGATEVTDDDVAVADAVDTTETKGVAAALRALRGPGPDKFANSPPGRARRSFLNGDQVFQTEFEVMTQEAIVIALVGSVNTTEVYDPTATLNAIITEGWELITGSFVFVVQGEQSRDKFFSSGQNVAVKGATMGYYLFRRKESNQITAAP